MNDNKHTRSAWLILWMATALPATVNYSDPWTSGLRAGSSLLLCGDSHCSLVGPASGALIESGHPLGLVGAAAAGGQTWIARRDGALLRIGATGIEALWQPADSLRAIASPGGEWLVARDRLLHVDLESWHPGVIAQWPLDQPLLKHEFRSLGRTAWLRSGSRLQRLESHGPTGEEMLPVGWQEWALRGDQPLCLQADGRLARTNGEVLNPDDASERRWQEMQQGPEGVWLRDMAGGWWCWGEGKRNARYCPGLPAKEHLLLLDERTALAQSMDTRNLWHQAAGRWDVHNLAARPLPLAGRLFRWAAEWRLRRDGTLLRLGQEGEDILLRDPTARALLHAGGGPILLCDRELRSFSEGGLEIGGWQGTQLHSAHAWEDWLLVSAEEALHLFWTGEDSPWLQQTLELSGAAQLAGSTRWVAARVEDDIVLLDRSIPWELDPVDRRPAPAGLRDLLMIEDHLLLLSRDDLLLWRAGENGWADADGSWLHAGGETIARRGVDRLLVQMADGGLLQLRHQQGRPFARDWRVELPLAGELTVFRDTLRVTGQHGWMDWPLPPLEEVEHEPGSGAVLVDRIRERLGLGDALADELPAGWELTLIGSDGQARLLDLQELHGQGQPVAAVPDRGLAGRWILLRSPARRHLHLFPLR